MDKRAEQVRHKFSKDFLKKNGKLPSTLEISKYMAKTDKNKPIFKPIVPENGAISSAEYTSDTLKAMLFEKRNISDVLRDISVRTVRLNESMDQQVSNFIDKSTAVINKFKTKIASTIFYDEKAPNPLPKSFNLLAGENGIRLERASKTTLAFRLISSPYNEQAGATPSLKTISKFPDLHFLAIGTPEFNKGVSMSLTLDKPNSFVSEFRIDTDPIYTDIYLNNSSTPFIKNKFLSGLSTLIIGKKVSKIRVVLYDSPGQLSIKIREMALYNTRYDSTGTFGSGEYHLPAFNEPTGMFTLETDQYIPSNSSIIWYYTQDFPVTGSLSYLPNTANDLVDIIYDSTGSDSTMYSALSRYVIYDIDDDEIIEYPEPTWTEFQPDSTVYWNSEESTNLTLSDWYSREYLIKIGILNENFIPSSIKLTYGNGALIFLSKKLAGSFFLQTYIEVDEGGYLLEMENPYLSSAGMFMFTEVSFGKNNEMEVVDLVETPVISTELSEGIYLISFQFNQGGIFDFINEPIIINTESYSLLDALKQELITLPTALLNHYQSPLDIRTLLSPDPIGREVTLKLSIEGLHLKDLDSLVYNNIPTEINSGAVLANGSLFVPKLAQSDQYSVILVPKWGSCSIPGNCIMGGSCSGDGGEETEQLCCTENNGIWEDDACDGNETETWTTVGSADGSETSKFMCESVLGTWTYYNTPQLCAENASYCTGGSCSGGGGEETEQLCCTENGGYWEEGACDGNETEEWILWDAQGTCESDVTCNGSEDPCIWTYDWDGSSWDPSHIYFEKKMSEIYADMEAILEFYDISYYITSDPDLNTLLLKAQLNGSTRESPIIRRVKLLNE